MTDSKILAAQEDPKNPKNPNSSNLNPTRSVEKKGPSNTNIKNSDGAVEVIEDESRIK